MKFLSETQQREVIKAIIGKPIVKEINSDHILAKISDAHIDEEGKIIAEIQPHDWKIQVVDLPNTAPIETYDPVMAKAKRNMEEREIVL